MLNNRRMNRTSQWLTVGAVGNGCDGWLRRDVAGGHSLMLHTGYLGRYESTTKLYIWR